jgi:hypothetical protein
LQGNLSAEKFQVKLLEISVRELQEELTKARNLHEGLMADRNVLDAEIPDLQLHAMRLNEEQDKLSAQLLNIATDACDEVQGLLEAVETKKDLLDQMTLERELVDYETLKIMAEIRCAKDLIGGPDSDAHNHYPARVDNVGGTDDEIDSEEKRVYELINKLNQIRRNR